MSGLILPPGYQHTAASDKAALDAANARAAELNAFEPYHSEALNIVKVCNKLNRIFAFTGVEPWTERQFETTAHNMMGDVGILVRIDWLQAIDPDTGEELPFRAPEVIPVGRVKKESERDHDRVKHEITSGIADGQPGFIREDGSRHEDPLKKVIT